MAKSRAEKLEELRQKEAQIKAQIQQLKQREQTEERKKDTRRKILIGGAVLAKIKRALCFRFGLKYISNGVIVQI